MKRSSLFTLAATAVLLTALFATAGLTQTPPGAYVSQDFAPGFDDLMTMLVQPRHIKLYYAGSAKNWELAAAESRDLRASFDRIIQTIPQYEGDDVGLSVNTFMKPNLDAIDAAIAGANSAKFATAYDGLTKGCNDCHTYMEHPFFVIKKPQGMGADLAHPDQDFDPKP